MANLLLPSNARPLERAIAFGVRERFIGLDDDLVKILDPRTTPERFLPWLAWARSIDLWDDTWSLEKKRSVVRRFVELHRLKGTEAGIAAHLDIVGTPLVKAVTPPVRAFTARNWTREEREKWLAGMPQLRLYRFLNRGTARNRRFLGHAHLNHMAMPLSDAQLRIGTRGFLWDRGELTPLRSAQVIRNTQYGVATTEYTVRLSGHGGNAFFCGQILKKKGTFLGKKLRSGRIYNIRVDDAYSYQSDTLQINTIQPTLDPIDVRYQYVQERGTASPASLFPHNRRMYDPLRAQTLSRRFLPPSTARERLYQRIYLHDPERAPTLRGSRSFLGNIRLGMQPYTAELDVLVINKRSRAAPIYFCRGFLHKTSPDKLNAALQAIRVAKAARDKCLVRTGLYKVPTIAKGIPMDGSFQFGKRVFRG